MSVFASKQSSNVNSQLSNIYSMTSSAISVGGYDDMIRKIKTG